MMSVPVAVFTPDTQQFIGTGNMVREDLNITDDDDDKLLFTLKDHPKITLDDDANVLYGIECWWMPISDWVTECQINHWLRYAKEAEP